MKEADGQGWPREKSLVLVVDDDPEQVRQIGSFLRRNGISVVEETNAYAAMRVIRHRQPALVLMDVKMPGLDGIEAARVASTLAAKPKIVLMSGDPDSVNAANCAHLGVHAVIDKPLPLRSLVEFIWKALARSR